MRVCQFNFNNEVNTFEIHVEDDGRVTVPGEGGQVLAEYDSVQQLAEIYAQARDVKPKNLKNWTLLENGNVYSFVLRAGTAGVDVASVEAQLEETLTSLAGSYHALSIARAREQILSDRTAELVDALVHCTETDVARDIYDAMSTVINGTAGAEAASAEEQDTRTDMEKYVDSKTEVPGALAFLALLAGVPVDSTKEEVLAALNGNFALSNVQSLRTVFNNTVNDVINEGIGVNNTTDALTVITQTASGIKDETVKNRLAVTANMAGRNAVNISVDIVGETHIRHTAEMIPIEELEAADLFVRDNVPYIVRFSDTIDAELEAERDAQEQAQNSNGEEEPYDEDDYEDED